MDYFITTDTHLTEALIACGQEMSYTRDGKMVYFSFPRNAILLDLVERYRNGNLHDGLLNKHDAAVYTVQKILKGKI